MNIKELSSTELYCELAKRDGDVAVPEIKVAMTAYMLKVMRQEIVGLLNLPEGDVYLELKIHRHPANSLLAKAAENYGAMPCSREGSDWLSLDEGLTRVVIFLDPQEPAPNEV